MLIRLALRSLRRHRRRTALTVGAVALGSFMVVFAWGFGEGIAAWLLRSAVSGRIGAVQVHAQGYLDTIDADPIALDLDVDAVMPHILAVPGVIAAAPRLRFGAIISTGSTSAMVQADAIDPVRDVSVSPDRFSAFAAGGPLVADGDRAIVIGDELARSLNVVVGDSVTLMASTKDGAQNALDFTVHGIAKGAAFLESKRIVTTRVADAEALLAMPGRAHEIAIAVNNADVDELVVHIVKRDLAQRLPDTSLEVHTWQDVSPFLRDGRARIRIVLRGVSLVLFLVVVLGVANTMVMSVFERTREIGTFIALGMRRRGVLSLFVLEAMAIGASGGIIGGAVGSVVIVVLGAHGLNFSPPGSTQDAVLYPTLSIAVVVGVAVATLVGAVFASFFPARRASRLDPVEALRAL